MSISYEEALSTLQAMFGEPWTRDTLDTVLRHYQGHMENTVESLLNHGDKDPQLLLDNLKNGVTSRDSSTSLDEELARQLSSGRGFPDDSQAPDSAAPATGSTPDSTAATAGSTSTSNASGPRGTPTTLPDDFLRVKTSTDQATLDSDAALARMLQDQLFSEELRRNPEFSHLAGGRRPSNNNNGSHPHATSRTSSTARGHQPMPMPNIMEKLNAMGTSAKFKLSQMAEQFKENTNRLASGVGGVPGGAGAGGPTSPETRGLLDRDGSYDGYELSKTKDL